MGARFVVRVGRRWRELDLFSGRVSGLGDVSLVRVRRGRLEVVPRAPALRALRTLLTAGSKRSAAKDGPRLSQIRYPVNPRRSKGRQEQQTDGHKKAPPVHACCQQHHYQCMDANFNSILRPPTSTVGVQCSGQAPAAPALSTHTDRVTDETEEKHTNNQSLRAKDHGSERLQNKNHESEEPKKHGGERIKRRTLLGRIRQTQESVSSMNAVAAVSEARRAANSRREPIEAKVLKNLNQKSLSSDSEFESGIGKNKLQRNKRPGRTNGRKAKRNEHTQEGPCKELLITEETVMLLRGFIERDQRNVFGVDLELYDTDDAYKAQFFYRLNPLVDLERCPQISRMLRERASRADTVSLQDFITKLGLRSVAESSGGQSRYRMRRRGDVTARRRASGEPRRVGAPDRDTVLAEKERSREENKLTTDRQAKPAASHTKPKTRDSSGKQLKEVVEVASNGGERGKKRPAKPSTGKLARSREYSREEDEFIVRWVRGEGRAKLVNGNRLWAQLQPQHHAGTGCFRSWHSLRNRYLRYLLPALGSLPLPPAEAARLRAAAATGSLKARKQPARRNSAFQQPPVRSAWARRPGPPPPETILVSDTEETQKRTLRSSSTLPHAAARTPPARTAARTPPARTAARTPPARTAARTPPARTAARTPPARADAFTRTPTYSELTKRFARRHRSTPATDTDTDTVGPTDDDATVTDTTDASVRHTRRSKRIRYSSDSDSGQAPERPSTRLSVMNGDVRGRHDGTGAREADKEHRHGDKTGRNHKTKRRSKSLDSDTDSLLNKRRRSARRDTSANKSDRLVNNSGRVADNSGSNKRKRSTSQDSDTGSQSNKRRRSRRLDSSAHTDSGRQNGHSKQTPDKRRSKSLDSDLDTPLYYRSNREKSVDKSGRQRAEENTGQGSGQNANKSDLRRDRSGRFTRTTDRQNGSVRGGDENDSSHKSRQRLSADKIMSKNYQKSEKSDRSDRQHTSGRRKDGHSENGRLADDTDRQKPRTRRLYNPNAI